MKAIDLFNKKIIALTFLLSLSSSPLLIPVKVFADEINISPCDPNNAPSGKAAAFGNLCPTGGTKDQVGPIIRNLIVAILIISAVVALLFLIWGGFKWITSGGDKTKVQAARDTIIAAIIGLIIAFLAYFILTVVLGLFGISLGNLSIPNLTG